MLRSAVDILKGFGNKILPTLGNIIGEGINIADKLGVNPQKYSRITDKLIHGIHEFQMPRIETYPHSYFQKFMSVMPSPNAAFGLGTMGPKEPSAAFVGDPQELLENRERIEHNPIPRSLQKLNRKIASDQTTGSSFIRDTGKRLPLDLMLPETKKKRKRRVYKPII